MECFRRADGNLHRHDPAAEMSAQNVHRFFKIGVFAIHFVDEYRTRQIQFFCRRPGVFRFDFDGSRSRNDDECRIRRRQGAFYFADKIGITRRVDKIELKAVPFAHGKRTTNRHATLFFFRIVIQKARAVVHFTQTRRSSGIKKTSLQKAGLTGFAMSYHRDVTQFVAVIFFQ